MSTYKEQYPKAELGDYCGVDFFSPHEHPETHLPWTCTRPAGHVGRHAAHGWSDDVLGVEGVL